MQRGADLLHHRAHDLRLYADENDVGLADGFYIVGEDGDAKRFRARLGFFRVKQRRAGGFGAEQAALQECLQQNAAHFAGAEYGDAGICAGCGVF